MAQATAISIGLHVGIILALTVVASIRPSKPIPPRVQVVSLVEDLEALGGGAPAAQESPPPRPEPEPEPPPKEPPAPVKTVEEPPPKGPPEEKKPREHEAPKPPPRPEPVAPTAPEVTPPTEEPEPAESPEAGLAVGDGTGGGGVPSIDSDAFQFAYYRQILINRLRSTWSRPLVPGGLAQPLRATIHFEILRSGAITDVSLSSESGHPPLDRSALRAVYDANPLPPLPDLFPGDLLAVNFYFELTPE